MMAVHAPRSVAAILVAAGSGTRLGEQRPKAFVTVAGATLLEHAAARFLAHPAVRDVVLVVPATALAQAGALVPGARVVAGGATRQQSVSNGLAALAAPGAPVAPAADGQGPQVVLVHDVARAFVPAAVIDRVIAAVRGGAQAAIPVLPVTDTIRRIEPGTGALHETVDRSTLAAVQTPQGFARPALAAAHEQAMRTGAEATDDAMLIEAQGGQVVAVAGDELAFKITYPLDLVLARAVAAHEAQARQAQAQREQAQWEQARQERSERHD